MIHLLRQAMHLVEKQKSLRFEIIEFHKILLCQWMFFRHERQQRFAAQGFASQSWTWLTSGCQGDIEFANFNPSTNSSSHVLHDLQYHFWIMLLKRHHQFWKHVWRDRGNCAHRQFAGYFVLELTHTAASVTDRSQNLARIVDQTTARFSEHN